MPSYRRIPALAPAVLALALAGAGAAQAHPFGPPLTATVAAEGSSVEVTWGGAEDDWMALGERAGAFAASPDPSLTGAEIVSGSAEVRDYLLDHVSVSQQGQECTATWEGIEDLLGAGARMSFECHQPVTTVEVTVTALTDINQAYRTVVSAGGQQTLFTATDPTHALDPTRTSGGDGTPVLLLSSAGAVVLAAGLGWALVSRRRASRLA